MCNEACECFVVKRVVGHCPQLCSIYSNLPRVCLELFYSYDVLQLGGATFTGYLLLSVYCLWLIFLYLQYYEMSYGLNVEMHKQV